MLAMGSYSSVGPVLAARRLGIPVVLHEANVIPGRAIDWLSRFAHTVAVNFPETGDYLPGKTVVVTGIPLRKELEAAAGLARLSPERFTILIMGGSQGARRVNELAVEALCRLHREGCPVNVVHLSGEKDLPTVSAAYQAAGIPHTVHGFLKEMATAYQGADLAIARSGANSCMELALFGIPALLVPYPLAARNHQVANARAIAAAGAADVIEQKDLTVDVLTAYIQGRMKDAAALKAMHVAARRRAMTGADEKLADLVEQVAAGR
jgi:UDP-N-acetylglucosamine--N-acetylmuramyl-(pentapeptide) pyrophosphoryl-undecaprenol N-acetylglucosamine transferase